MKTRLIYSTTARILILATASLIACASLILFAWPALAHDEDPYNDLNNSLWREEIMQLENRGIFVGTECGESLFCPNEPALRQLLAVWLIRALEGDDSLSPAASHFSDVDAESFWAQYIERLAELGITNGCGEGRFCPEGRVSRAHLAVFLTRAYDLPEGVAPVFQDVDSDAWYAAAIRAAASDGLIDSCQSGAQYFCPSLSATRAEVASAIARAEATAKLLAVATLPHTPRAVYISRNDSGGLWVKWRKPWYDGGMPITQYRLQWHAEGQEFDSSRQIEISDIDQLGYTIEDLSADLVYTVKVMAISRAGVGSPSPAVKETDFNHALLELSDLEVESLEFLASSDLSRLLRDRLWYYMENEMLPRYEDEHPWLRQAWTHYKHRVTFTTICIGAECSILRDGHVSFDCRVSSDPDEELPACRLVQLTLRRQYMYSDALLAHELGHILTLANGVVEDSAPLAMAFLYFVNLSDGDDDDCPASELYADTLETLTVRQAWPGYWYRCRQLPERTDLSSKSGR